MRYTKVQDTGIARGKHYAVNVPMREGMDDESYASIFEPVMTRVMDVYQPEAIVLQCGADSVTGERQSVDNQLSISRLSINNQSTTGDRLGSFNLTTRGHGACARFMRRFNVPMLMLGGGGYTIRNVARAWTYETSIAVGVEIPDGQFTVIGENSRF